MFRTNVVDKIKTQFMFNNSSPPENRAVFEIMWINKVQPERPQMTIWRMRIAYCITKATNTHSEYVIVNAFPLQNGCTNAPQCYVIRSCLV